VDVNQSQELFAANQLMHLQTIPPFPSDCTHVEPWLRTLKSKESLHAALSRASKVGILRMWGSALISIKLTLMKTDSTDT
jgi:hypothetical protein